MESEGLLLLLLGTVCDLLLETVCDPTGAKDVPVGIQAAMVGMKKGEKRRVELPSAVGFETSDWAPAPVRVARWLHSRHVTSLTSQQPTRPTSDDATRQGHDRFVQADP